MGIDSGVFSGPNGSLRLFTLILGAIDLGITYHSSYDVQDEKFFLWTVIVLLIASAILAVVAFLGIHSSAVFVRKADYIYHVVGGVVLLVAGIIMSISVAHYDNQGSTGKYVERWASAIIGIINALIYCSLGWSSCRS